MNHGSNAMSIKRNVNGIAGPVNAVRDAGWVFSRLIALASAAATVSAQAEPTSLARVRTAARPALAVDVGRATSAGAPLLDGTAVAGFEVIWAGRLSTSAVPADDSQWWWLRGQGVNTIVNLDAVMYDFAQYGFESFLWMPVAAGEAPADQGAQRLLKFIQLCDNEPVHISGGARDGRVTLVALLRYAIDAWTIEAALGEGQRLNCGAPLSSKQVTWLLGWAESNLPGSERLVSCSRVAMWRRGETDESN